MQIPVPSKWSIRFWEPHGICQIEYRPYAGYSSGLGLVRDPFRGFRVFCLTVLGWFPFLFYSTTWVGEVYFRYSKHVKVEDSKDSLGDIGRVGSLSLVVFSIITFAGSVLLPWVVQSPDTERRVFTPRPPRGIAPIVTTLQAHKPDLVTAWMVSHLIFAGSMALAPFVRSLRMASILVSICGM